MDLSALYHQARTIRLYTNEAVNKKDLGIILENVRIASNATNRQTLRYIVIIDPKAVSIINHSVTYASLIPHKGGTPKENQYPPIYIAVVQTKPSPISDIDVGIVADVIKMSAASLSLGTCIMASFKNLDTLLGIAKG